MEIELKNYYNENLDTLLSKYITEKKYKAFVPIVKDLFQRRAYEFGFSNKQMKKEIKKFVKNCREIEFFENSKEETEGNQTLGLYNPETKKISLNIRIIKGAIIKEKENIKKNYSEVYERENITEEELNTLAYMTIFDNLYNVFTHEAYHAIKPVVPAFGISQNEIFTERAANRCTQIRTEANFETYSIQTKGYENLTNLLDLLKASCALTEKELLGAGIQDDKKLKKQITNKFSKKQKKDAFKLYELFSYSSEHLYYFAMKIGNVKKLSDIEKEDKEMLKKAMEGIFLTSYSLLCMQMDFENAPNYNAENYYRINTMKANTKEILYNFGLFMMEDFEEFYVSVKKEYLDKYEDFIKQCEKGPMDCEYFDYIKREDFDNFKVWNNNEVIKKLSAIYQNSVRSSENFDNRIKVSKENLNINNQLAPKEEIKRPSSGVSTEKYH